MKGERLGALEELLRGTVGDLRYALRVFSRQPAVLTLAILGLSLGLAIATAAFSIMNAAVLRGEGLADPDRTPGVLRITDRSESTAWNYDEFLYLREGTTRMQLEAVFTDTARVGPGGRTGDAPSASVAFVTGGFFPASGGKITAGRALDPADEQHTGPPPVVVSFAFWSGSLNRDPHVVGRPIRVGGTDATIVGVADRAFSVPHRPALWIPLTAYRAVYDVPHPAARNAAEANRAQAAKRTPDLRVEVFGRLSHGVSLDQAEAQLDGVAAGLPRPAKQSAIDARLDRRAGLGRMPSGDALAIALVVFAAIALVIVMACSNVASVLVASAITREREMGIRAALGASRWRIGRQLVTESLALGTVAAILGLLFSWWALPTIGVMIEAPAGSDLSSDSTVYLFVAVVTILSSVGAGIAPAWHGRGADLLTPLKGDGARQNRAAPRRLRSALVATQATVSVILILVATLFVRAALRVAEVDAGFGAEGLYTVSPGLGEVQDDGARISRFWARAVADLPGVPGVSAVTLAELTPFGGLTRTSITREDPSRVIAFNRTRANYFEAMGVRVLAGRSFTPDEQTGRVPVALVSASLARAYWEGRSPLGELLPAHIPVPPYLALSGGRASLVAAPRPTVIGVVADVVAERLHEQNALAVYEPLDPAAEPFAQLLIRETPGTSGGIDRAKARLRAIDPQADVRITSVAARLRQEAARPRMLATLTGVVGVVAIALCVVGLYGLTASAVGARAREMAVRAAIGATPGDLLRLLVWDSIRPVVLGLVIGAGGALLAGRLGAAFVFFGVSPHDPAAFAGAAAILLAAAMLAVLSPTRRAAAVDAAQVLRHS
jgi:putative ABC transport system permease protein